VTKFCGPATGKLNIAARNILKGGNLDYGISNFINTKKTFQFTKKVNDEK
jgi:hypothetical protein